mgnify:CR=1 FL=1
MPMPVKGGPNHARACYGESARKGGLVSSDDWARNAPQKRQVGLTARLRVGQADEGSDARRFGRAGNEPGKGQPISGRLTLAGGGVDSAHWSIWHSVRGRGTAAARNGRVLA